MTKSVVFSVTRKDFDVSWFSGTGAGGQNRNRKKYCCRLRHNDTGVTKVGQSHKSREQNLKEAFKAMVNDPRFRSFCATRLKELEDGETIEERVDKMMRPENLRIETRQGDSWGVSEEN